MNPTSPPPAWPPRATVRAQQPVLVGQAPRPLAPLTWHPVGQTVRVDGYDIPGGVYSQNVPREQAYPFALNLQLPLRRIIPTQPVVAPGYGEMSPEHRKWFHIWLTYRSPSIIPAASHSAYLETWLQGLEWRLWIQGAYEPSLVSELERVLGEHQACLSGTTLEQSILDLLCYTTFCRDRAAFSPLWQRLASSRRYFFRSLSRQLILTDLFEHGEPVTADLVTLILDPFCAEPMEILRLFRSEFAHRYPQGKPLREPLKQVRRLRYHSNCVEFERRADQCCPGLELPCFESNVDSLSFEFNMFAMTYIGRERAAAEAAREAESKKRWEALRQARLRAQPRRRTDGFLDLQQLERIHAETLEVRGILTPILEDRDERATASSPAASEGPGQIVPGWAAGLSTCFVPALVEICTRAEWSKTEFESVCRKHQLTGLAFQDAVNAWADEKLGDFLLEGDDPIRVQQHLLQSSDI